MENYKIIFHFKSIPDDMKTIKEIKKIIKDFYENSLVVFGDDIEIHVIE